MGLRRIMFVVCTLVVGGLSATCPCGYKTSSGDVWKESIVLDFTKTNDAVALAKTAFSIQSWTSSPSKVLQMHCNPANIYNGNGGLGMKVSAYTGSGPVQVSEMDSIRTDFLYGSFRVSSVVPSVKGVCYSMFLYKDDTHEIDIEFLSSDAMYYNTAHYTNQPGSNSNSYQIDTWAGQDYTTFHTHRIDWLSNSTIFYVNDTLRKTLTGNVPRTSLLWIVNNWSNGDPGWTYGPPTSDAVVTIHTLAAYFNSTSFSDSQFKAQCASAGSTPVCNV